jgi:hypothetical protein
MRATRPASDLIGLIMLTVSGVELKIFGTVELDEEFQFPVNSVPG